MTMVATERPAGRHTEQVIELGRALRELILAGEHFRLRKAEELHLGASDILALGHLFHHQPLAPKELSTLMKVTSGTMTALLDRVEKAGFVRRENNPRDRRGLLISLTPAGDHALQWLYEEFEAAVRETLTGVPDLAAEQAQRIITGLSIALEAANTPPAST